MDSHLYEFIIEANEKCGIDQQLKITLENKPFTFFTEKKLFRFSVNVFWVMTFSVLSVLDQIRKLTTLDEQTN